MLSTMGEVARGRNANTWFDLLPAVEEMFWEITRMLMYFSAFLLQKNPRSDALDAIASTSDFFDAEFKVSKKH